MKMLITKFVLLFPIFGVISGLPYNGKRRNAVYKKDFAIIPDAEGHLHFVNLTSTRDTNITVTLDDFHVFFYSRLNPTKPRILSPHTFNGSVGEGFDPSKKSIFCVHGWIGMNNSDTCTDLKEAAVENNLANIFVVDYYRIAHVFYTLAVGALPELGKICGNFIDLMLDHYKLDSKQIMLIGHSLGGQLVSYCASSMRQKPGEILGLDPAQPLFSSDDPDNCLGPEDADVVHVIHTNKGLLGFDTSIGHADYYVNGGGMDQPGCGPDLIGMCAHRRAIYIYGESIISEVGFRSLRCDSYEDYLKGACENNATTYFGGITLDKTAKGDYYFDTNDEPPYALP